MSKALGIYWTGSVNQFQAGFDVLTYEVRTRTKPEYELPVRPIDDFAKTFVLVRRLGPAVYDVVGWIKGHDAKRNEWLHDYGGRPAAWFVPDQFLLDPELLRPSAGVMIVGRVE